MSTCDKIFVTYSHQDRKLFEEFKIMLTPAILIGAVDVWDDTKITPGAKWKEEIQKALGSASIAVLLVSPNFLASHFIVENELPPLLKAAQEEGVTIFWIYLSSCLFEQTEIATYQAAHDTSRPLDRLTKSRRQAVLSEACVKLIRATQVAPPPMDHPTGDALQAARTQVQAAELDKLRAPSPGSVVLTEAELEKEVVQRIRLHTFAGDDKALQDSRIQLAEAIARIAQTGIDEIGAEAIWAVGNNEYNNSLRFEFRPDLAALHVEEADALNAYLVSKILSAPRNEGKPRALHFLGVHHHNMVSIINHKAYDLARNGCNVGLPAKQ